MPHSLSLTRSLALVLSQGGTGLSARFVLTSCLLASLVWLAPAAGVRAADSTDQPASDPAAEHLELFSDSVLPILRENCFSCHAGDKSKGGLRLDTRAGLVAGGDSGSAIDEADPEYSLIVEAVRYESFEMPPRGQLDEDAIDAITRWVAAGAPYLPEMQGDAAAQRPADPGAEISEADRGFWAFQPLSDPEVPALPAHQSAANPIDAFIAEARAAQGLTANPPAEPDELIRRLHYDLTGLPPSRELVAAYVADPSEKHYQRIVDQLLASPQYGERWGRHWLDLVRYAETNSYERDGAKPEVWRYRDYVVESLNEDKPFDQFTM